MTQLLTFISQFLIGFVGISIVLIIHELAHFITARLLKVNVEEFSIGMGPRVFTLQGKKTSFTLRLLPLGGSTRMNGSTDLTRALREDAKDFNNSEAGSFFSTSPIRRFFIFFAGSSGLDGTTRRPKPAPHADMCGRAPKTSVSVSGPARNAGQITTGT